MTRVRIGTCSDLADAALVRAALEAHEIHVVINAENHARMLGNLGGSFLPLHIFVDDSEAEQATALLADIRARSPEDDDDVGEPEHANDDETEAEVGLLARADHRRRIGIILVLALAVAFSMPYVLDRPVFAVGLMVGGVVAMVATWWGRPRGPQIPRAHVKRP